MILSPAAPSVIITHVNDLSTEDFYYFSVSSKQQHGRWTERQMS